MTTSPKQTSLFTGEQLTSSPEGSPVKMQVSQSKMGKVNRGYKVRELDCYMKCVEQSEKLTHGLLLTLRMWLTFLKLTKGQTLAQYSPNYPQWGTMQNGEFVVLQKSVRPIIGQGCIWLLTPTASDYKRDKLSFPMYTRRHGRSPGSLTEHLYRLFGEVTGNVSHQLYAWMMGYPPYGWILKITMEETTNQSIRKCHSSPVSI